MQHRGYLQYFLFFILAIACRLTAISQVISYPVPAQSISRGLDSSLLTVRIDFPACSDVRVKINLGAINTPGVIEYIPGSVTAIAGSPSLSIAESDITDLQNPEFLVGNTDNGQFITFTIKRRANCGTASSTKDNVTVSSSGSCNAVDDDANNNNYNLLAPTLTLVPPPSMVNTDVGNTYTRNFTITNGGLGCVDTLGLWLVYPASSVQFVSLKVGAEVLTPAYTNGDSLYFQVSGTALGANKQLCNTGSAISFAETFTILKCDVNTRYGAAWYDHDGNSCQRVTATANLTMNNRLPLLTTTLPNPNHNYCFRGESLLQQLRITNSGAGPATEIVLYARGAVPASHESYTYPDTSRPWTVRNAAGDSIGVIRNFQVITNTYPLRTFYDAGCASSLTPMEVKGFGSNTVIVPAGAYLTVDVYYKAQNFSCPSFATCGIEGISFVSINGALEYQNSCRTANYNESYKNFFNRSYAYLRSTLEMPSDISGNEPFDLTINANLLRTVNKLDLSGQTYIAIAVGSTGIAPNASAVTIKGIPFPMAFNASHDTILIGPLFQNQVFDNSRITVPLIAACGTGGTKTISVSLMDQYAPCAPVFRMACKNVSTNLHCPSPCPRGGATPQQFVLKRISYGLPDNDNDHIADAGGSIDLSKISDHHSVNGDTLQGIWQIKLFPNTEPTDPNVGQPFKYVYVDFDLGANAGTQAVATLNALPNARVLIYPNSNPAATPIICSVTPTITGTGGRYAHYQIDAGCRGGNFATNDSIVVIANYTVNYYNAYRYNGTNSSSPTTIVTKNEVYSTYVQKTVNQTAPLNGQTYTCDHYNDYNEISGILFSLYIPPTQVINGCTNSLSANFRQYTRSQEGPNIFPYELRNFGLLDTMKITLPPGFTYRAGSGYFNATRYNISSNAYTTPSITAAAAGVVVTQTGNILVVANISKVYTVNGGTIIPADEQEDIRFYFSVDPTCDAANGVYPNNLWTSNIGNNLNTPAYHKMPTAGSGYSNGWIYTAPIPVISGGSTVISADGSGTWNVVLQNQSNQIAANNSYFYISPTNGFTNIVVKEGNTTITPDANGFYRLSTLATSANRNFTIQARTTVCGADSMAINFGWGCTGYPTAYSPQNCTKTVWLKIDNYPSQIQLTVDKQPQTPSLDFCATDYVEFSINSAAGGFADNPRFLVTPPPGVNITSAQIQYPWGSGMWYSVTPVIVGDVYTYRIEDHPAVQAMWGTRGLPGVINNPGADNRKAKLRLTYNTTCGFVNNSRFLAQQQAERPCGDPIPANLGYNNSVRTNSITITNAAVPGSASFLMSSTAPAQRCNNFTVTGRASTLATSTATGDTIKITIPNGLEYVAGSFAGVSSPVLIMSSNSPVLTPSGETILKLVVPAGISSGTAMNYQYQVVPKKMLNGCGSFQLSTEYIRTSSPYTCSSPAYTCVAAGQTIMGNDVFSITVTKARVRITSVRSAPSNPTPGQPYPTIAEVTLANDGATPEPAGTTVEFFCGNNATPFATLPFPNSIAANGSSTATMNITIPAGCGTLDQIRAVVRPTAAVAQCVCDSSSATSYSLLPVYLEDFTGAVANCRATLRWTIGKGSSARSFSVEASKNGYDYQEVAVVEAVAGQRTYSYQTPAEESLSYWRIKTAAYDQAMHTSNSIRLYAPGCQFAAVDVYPNPAVSVVNIELKGFQGINDGALYNAQGQIIKKLTLYNGRNTLNISGISKGIYNLVIWNKQQQAVTKKIRVEE